MNRPLEGEMFDFNVLTVGSASDVQTIEFNTAKSPKPTLLVNRSKEGVGYEQYMDRMRDANAGVFDIDGTVEEGSLHDISRTVLSPEEAAAELAEVRACMETSPRDHETLATLIRNSAKRRARAGVTRRQLKDAMKGCARPRDGTYELWAQYGRHVCLATYGYADLGHMWQDDAFPEGWEHIPCYGAQLTWSGEGDDAVVTGVKEWSIVTQFTKDTMAEKFLAKINVEPSEAAAYGDAVTDIGLFKTCGLATFIISQRDPEPKRQQSRMQRLAQVFDHVDAFWLTPGTLRPLADMARGKYCR